MQKVFNQYHPIHTLELDALPFACQFASAGGSYAVQISITVLL